MDVVVASRVSESTIDDGPGETDREIEKSPAMTVCRNDNHEATEDNCEVRGKVRVEIVAVD